jgi:hypothetical protein
MYAEESTFHLAPLRPTGTAVRSQLDSLRFSATLTTVAVMQNWRCWKALDGKALWLLSLCGAAQSRQQGPVPTAFVQIRSDVVRTICDAANSKGVGRRKPRVYRIRGSISKDGENRLQEARFCRLGRVRQAFPNGLESLVEIGI